jgi:hypothetical protein
MSKVEAAILKGVEKALDKKKRHKLIFKNGTQVILTRDYVARPKMSCHYSLKAGQTLKVVSQGYYTKWDLEDALSEPTPWVRCNGKDPETGKKYHFDFAVDVPVLIEATEANRLLYATQV